MKEEIWIGLRLEFSKISRNVLTRPVMGTIFLVNAEKHLHFDFESVRVYRRAKRATL